MTVEEELQFLMTYEGNSHWKTHVSAEVKQLISYMVLSDQNSRPTIESILQHPWI